MIPSKNRERGEYRGESIEGIRIFGNDGFGGIYVIPRVTYEIELFGHVLREPSEMLEVEVVVYAIGHDDNQISIHARSTIKLFCALVYVRGGGKRKGEGSREVLMYVVREKGRDEKVAYIQISQIRLSLVQVRTQTTTAVPITSHQRKKK